MDFRKRVQFLELVHTAVFIISILSLLAGIVGIAVVVSQYLDKLEGKDK